MPDQPISQLNVISSLLDTDIIPIVNQGETRKATLGEIGSVIASIGLTTPTAFTYYATNVNINGVIQPPGFLASSTTGPLGTTTTVTWVYRADHLVDYWEVSHSGVTRRHTPVYDPNNSTQINQINIT